METLQEIKTQYKNSLEKTNLTKEDLAPIKLQLEELQNRLDSDMKTGVYKDLTNINSPTNISKISGDLSKHIKSQISKMKKEVKELEKPLKANQRELRKSLKNELLARKQLREEQKAIAPKLKEIARTEK